MIDLTFDDKVKLLKKILLETDFKEFTKAQVDTVVDFIFNYLPHGEDDLLSAMKEELQQEIEETYLKGKFEG